ncbi:type I DNA topoisomerase [bacterium]|nr:type I DNA topoisomerase [bacterium]
MPSKNLLIVESPGKIKTLSKILGSSFVVEASKGHIMDLPKSKLGVDVENGFQPDYSVVKDRSEVIRKLKDVANHSDKIYLAPDPDREGEAISWHLATILKIDPTSQCRVTFNSITHDSVLQSIRNPKPIDLNLVNAQQSRRILDRLVGYKLSPLLWKKVQVGLSAGRVQSVAVLLICEREKEILSFVPVEYWTIKAILQTSAKETFEAKLVKTDGKKSVISDQASSQKVIDEIRLAQLQVVDISQRSKKQTPPPPFITSSLQQDAYRRFSFTAKRTMSIAQKLYEGVAIGKEGPVGLITYMRTDSFRVAPEALSEAFEFVDKTFGKLYSLPQGRFYRTKKGAQDAHEAIRPTSVWRTPESLVSFLTPEAHKLYSLIWKRFVATQMAEAVYDILTIDISAGIHTLQVVGTTVKFDGFTKLYSEMRQENDRESQDKDDAENLESESQRLPKLSKNENLTLKKLDPTQNFTQPPTRYNESMLVKTLEKEGIGRPSTYATIIDTIQQRGYVKKVESRFRPSDAAFVTTNILTGFFSDIITTRFTAKMESFLDEIEEGKKDWVSVLKDFYSPFLDDIKKADAKLKKVEFNSDCVCPKCGKPMVVKFGRAGKFLACSGYPNCKSTEHIPEEMLITPTSEGGKPIPLKAILEKVKLETALQPVETTTEVCEKCGANMVVKTGRFGKFLACPKYPDCKNTKRIVQDLGIPCPIENCGGKISVKRSKKGRIFYGCSNYPTCTFVSWSKPINEICPKCKSVLTNHKTIKLGPHVKCTNKACDYKRTQESSEISEKR